MNEWNPMDTAPKDREILVWNSITGIYRTKYDVDIGRRWPLYFWGRQGEWFPEPTQWAELSAFNPS